MKRTLLSILAVLLLASGIYGQVSTASKVERPNTKKVNFGIKAGFNSSMFLVSDFRIKDVSIDDIQNNYEIGYFASLFMRINMKRHFLQPEVSYNINRCEIEFDKLGSHHPDIEPDYAQVRSTIHSFDIPLLYGYNVIKDGPYGMSIFGGPKLRYVWGQQNEITFVNFDQQGIYERLTPFNASMVLGVGVNISQIFFDFRYDLGMFNISRSVTYDNVTPEGEIERSRMDFKRRDYTLSFSLGVIF